MKKIISKLDSHTKEILQKTSAAFIVKILGLIGGLGVSVFIGRTLGAEGLGIINLANRTALLIMIITLFGLPDVIVKEVSIGYSRQDWKHISGFFKTAILISILSLFIFVLSGIGITPFLTETVFHNDLLKAPLYIAIIAIIAQVFSRIFSSTIIGMGKIWQGNLVNETLSLWTVGIGLLILYFLEIQINIFNVALIYGISRFVVTITIGIYLKSIINYIPKPQLYLDKTIKTSWPLLFVSASFFLTANTSSLMLGWLSNAKEVGYFEVASRLALLTSFFLQVSNSALSPKIASLFANSKMKELNKMVQQVTKGLIFLGILSLILFIFCGNFILSLWGTDFKQAYLILIILSFGQFVNLATGAVGLLLIMTGYEKKHRNISITFLFLNIVFNLVFIYYYGAIGAAIATSLTVSGENFFKYIFVKKYIGINTINLK